MFPLVPLVSALQAAGRPREAARWLRRVVQPEVSHSLLQRAASSRRLDLGAISASLLRNRRITAALRSYPALSQLSALQLAVLQLSLSL